MVEFNRRLTKIVEHVLVVIFSLLVIDVLWQVIARYFIGQTSAFTEEFARFALIWLAMLSAAYLSGTREHLAIDFLVSKLPPDKQIRRRTVIEVIMLVFVLVVMVAGGINLVYITLKLEQTSSAMGVPLGLVYSIVPISGLIMVFYSIFHLRKSQTIQAD